jgi:hypothetical protein
MSRRDGAHGREQLLGGGALEQEAAGSCPDRLEHPGLVVEGGQDQHPRAATLRRQLPGGLHAVQVRHAQVHEDDVGLERPALLDSLPTAPRLGHHPEVGLGLEQQAQAGPQQGVVVHQDDPDHGAPTEDTGSSASTASPRRPDPRCTSRPVR